MGRTDSARDRSSRLTGNVTEERAIADRGTAVLTIDSSAGIVKSIDDGKTLYDGIAVFVAVKIESSVVFGL